MALDDYHHGVRVIEVADGPRPIRTVATSVIGMIATASDADASTFPLNTPVLVSDIYSSLSKAGDLGTLAKNLEAIDNQTRAVGVIVRVAEGEGANAEAIAAATTSNVIGSVQPNGQRTGMQALLTAQSALGIKPRILGAPGLENQAVITAFATLAPKLRAFVYAADNESETVSEAITYRNNFSSRELMLMLPDFMAWDTTTSANVRVPAAAYALGLRAKIDNEIGWHKTLSNVAVTGVTGLSKSFTWDLQDSATDAGLLNAADITTLINSNGFRFWGSRTCSDDPRFPFENQVRTSQIIADTIAEAHMAFNDTPMNPSISRDVLEGVRDKMRSWVTRGYLLGAGVWFDETVNLAGTLQNGQQVFDYDYTCPPPLEDITFRQRITDRYFADFAARVAAAA